VILWWSILKINRLSGCTDWIDLDFVERQRTPERAMKLGIQLQLAGLSLSNTISIQTGFSALKRRFGPTVHPRTWYREFRELVVTTTVYNLEHTLKQ